MNPIYLSLELNNAEFRKVVRHIHNNMFFGVKRIAPNLRHLVLHSIGDQKNDDLSTSEVFIEKQIQDSNISTDEMTDIIKNLNWYLKLSCGYEHYLVTIDKRTDMITDRDFTKKALEI